MDEPGTEPTARQIAAFDFDGTLTRRDTVLPFLVRLFGARRVARAVSRVAPTAARPGSADSRASCTTATS